MSGQISNINISISHLSEYFTSLLLDVFMSNFIVHNVANFLLALPQNENRSLEQKSRYQKQEVSNISLVRVIISKVADNYAVKNV